MTKEAHVEIAGQGRKDLAIMQPRHVQCVLSRATFFSHVEGSSNEVLLILLLLGLNRHSSVAAGNLRCRPHINEHLK